MNAANTIDDECFTALHCALDKGHSDVAKRLVENKADVNIGDCYERKPILKAIHFLPDEDLIRLLLHYKANVNESDDDAQTALHWAAQYGHVNNVMCLVDKKANVNAENYKGETSLHLAVKYGMRDVVRILLLLMQKQRLNIPRDLIEDQTVKKAQKKIRFECRLALIKNANTIIQSPIHELARKIHNTHKTATDC